MRNVRKCLQEKHDTARDLVGFAVRNVRGVGLGRTTDLRRKKDRMIDENITPIDKNSEAWAWLVEMKEEYNRSKKFAVMGRPVYSFIDGQEIGRVIFKGGE